MPVAAPRPCSHPGCRQLVKDGNARCQLHKVRDGSFADARRGTRHERGYGSDWDRLRKLILARDMGLCQECLRANRLTPVGDKPFSAFVDHIVPKAEGGTDAEHNLQTLCAPCHKAKTDAEKQRGRRGEGKSLQPLPPRTDR